MLVPRLGAHPDVHGATFAVFSRGDTVELCLLEDDGAESRIALTGRTRDVWHGHVDGVRPGQRYAYRVHGPWDPSRGLLFNPDKLLADPYARAFDGALHSVVVDPTYDWGHDRAPDVPWSDTVIYELHVKGFTARHPDVPEHMRGTYAGLAHPAVIDYLVDLGVTSLELLPVHQFTSEPAVLGRGQVNYWGYNTLGFFAPHAGYSSTGSRGEQVREFRDLVRALHTAGIEVLLDVVYNHTAEGPADGPTLGFRGLDNVAYYRLAEDGRYLDVTGCGNTLDLRHPRTLALVTDSLRYWAEEMHVDGFRFDLAPALARGSDSFDANGTFLAVIEQDPLLSRVKLVAEPWDLGPGGYRLGEFPPPWVEWNDRYRDAARVAWLGGGARGSNDGDAGLRDLAHRLVGSSDVFAARGPLASVNYVTSHDGFTLHDLVSYDRKHNEANGEDGQDGSDTNHSWNCGTEGPTDDRAVLCLRRRMMRNLLTTLLISAGVPMLTAGDEIGRTQRGNNNPYCLDDETTWSDWEPEAWQRDLLDWTRALLALRRGDRALRHAEFFTGQPVGADVVKDLAWFGADGQELAEPDWHEPGRQVLGMYLTGIPEPDDPEVVSLLVLFNIGIEPAEARLPGPPWASSYALLLDTCDESPTSGARIAASDNVRLPEHSVRVLAART